MCRRNRKPVSLVLGLGIALILVVACGGQGESGGQAEQTPVSTATGGKLPRTDRLSAADFEKGEGTDICDRFEKPVPQPYDPGPGNPLQLFPIENVRGVDGALVTVIMYGDFQCGECATLAADLKLLVETQPDEVRVAFRQLPMPANDKAQLAAIATEVAADMGGNEAFWAMHDLIYEHQSEWRVVNEASFRERLAGFAEEIGLDVEEFSAALDDEAYVSQIELSVVSAGRIGVSTAPTLFINDLPVDQPPGNFETLAQIVEIILLQMMYSEPPPMEIDPDKDYMAWIVTEDGDIAIDLYADLAPVTVNNFAYLACIGFYDNVTWHRVIPGFMAQGGDPTGTGFGGPGYTIPDEFANSLLEFDREGQVSMAHSSQPNSANSQFFITYDAQPHLNGAFTIFGQVVGGMNFVRMITPRDQSQSVLVLPPGDKIITIIVREL